MPVNSRNIKPRSMTARTENTGRNRDINCLGKKGSYRSVKGNLALRQGWTQTAVEVERIPQHYFQV